MAIHISYPHPFFLWKHVKASWTTVTPLVEWIFPPTSGHEPSLCLLSWSHSILSNTYNEHTLGTFSCRFLRQYFWHWCVALWPATGLLCPCQRVSASRPPYWTSRTPYICQPDLFNQRTSVQAPAFGFPPSSTPLIPHIFANIPFLSATKVTIVPQGTHIPTYCQSFPQH